MRDADPPRRPTASCARFCTLTMLWLSAYATVLARAGDVLRWPRLRRMIDGLSGTALVAFGLRLATVDREV